jgi:HlyD family secretion protein
VALLRPSPLAVETAPARRGALRVTIDGEGRSRVRDRYVVTAPVAGRLVRLALAAGDSVRAGDVVARLDPAPLDAATLREAQARVAAARAVVAEALTRVRASEEALAQARRDAARQRELAAAGAVASRVEEESALAEHARREELAAARARVRAAEADVERAAAALLHLSGRDAAIAVRAPAAGRVLRVADPSERIVAPGATLVEIGDPRRLEVVVDLLSSDAARVRAGMVALLEGWGDAEPVTARVRLVEPSARTKVSALGVEEQRVDVVLAVEAPPPTLGDGYRVDVRIVTWEGRDVLGVPTSALVRDDAGAWGAFVVRGGRAELRPLRLGQMGTATAQVLEGLAEGEPVVLFPSDKVLPGARVKARG